MNVPFTDISIKNTKKYLFAINKVIKKGDFILSKEVEKFEKEFALYIGARYCIGVSSGTDAILLSLCALNISSNDEVIVPAFSFVASVTPIIMLGAKPVFVDVQKKLPIIDEEKIVQHITKKTKAIIAVHLYGYPCNVKKLRQIADKYNIYLIEDAAQAHGTMVGTKRIGLFGDVATFSFYPSKNLGAFGDGGCIVTNDKTIFTKLRLLRNHGQKDKYQHEIIGYNSRLDTIQAAVLRLKLKKLNKEIKQRANVAEIYKSFLKDLPIKIFENLKNTVPALHLFVIRTSQRDNVKTYLEKKGIKCGIHYPTALTDEKIFSNYIDKNNSYPNAKEFASTVLSLPFFPSMSRLQIFYIYRVINTFFSKKD